MAEEPTVFINGKPVIQDIDVLADNTPTSVAHIEST